VTDSQAGWQIAGEMADSQAGWQIAGERGVRRRDRNPV